MKKHRTKEEINELNAYATKVGLDGRIAYFCRDTYEVDKLFEIQEKMSERRSAYYYLKMAAPKDSRLEHEQAVTHQKALAEYLYNAGQHEAVKTLNDIVIGVNEAKNQDYKTKQKEYIREEAENLHFSKTAIKKIVRLLMEYLSGKHPSEYRDFPPNSTPSRVARKMSNQIISNGSDDIEKFKIMQFKKAFYDLSHIEDET